MKRILEILTLLLFVTLTLSVQADDYVDDVYFWPYDSRSANVAKPTASNTGNDSVRVIEFLPQENDTVVKIRIKDLSTEKKAK